MNAVPVPNYVRRDGVYNLSSHFPKNAIAPDLGPKMYNALASSQQEGSHGSTRLHMDMADAVNVMTYAEPQADGTPGFALWDLFKAEDADQLRRFLRLKYPQLEAHIDPIHSQYYYLTPQLLQDLYDTTEVRSYRIRQYPGQAIFIPAGCAHQVRHPIPILVLI